MRASYLIAVLTRLSNDRHTGDGSRRWFAPLVHDQRQRQAVLDWSRAMVRSGCESLDACISHLQPFHIEFEAGMTSLLARWPTVMHALARRVRRAQQRLIRQMYYSTATACCQCFCQCFPQHRFSAPSWCIATMLDDARGEGATNNRRPDKFVSKRQVRRKFNYGWLLWNSKRAHAAAATSKNTSGLLTFRLVNCDRYQRQTLCSTTRVVVFSQR